MNLFKFKSLDKMIHRFGTYQAFTCYVLPPYYVYYHDTGHHKQEVVRDWNDSLWSRPIYPVRNAKSQHQNIGLRTWSFFIFSNVIFYKCTGWIILFHIPSSPAIPYLTPNHKNNVTDRHICCCKLCFMF